QSISRATTRVMLAGAVAALRVEETMGDMRVCRSIFFAVGLGLFSFALSGMAAAADFYFHGMTDDQAQKVASGENGTPPPAGNLTFDSNGPNACNAAPIRQL